MKLSKTYDPGAYESDIYALWEKSGAFKPKNRGGEGNFSIVLPPPNANGDLHVGHCLMFALQDCVIRYHRMKGDSTLWLPGADHAGFETQVVYEKKLAKAGKSRFDLSRDELYRQIWDFVEGNRSNYENQFRRFGASVDWSKFVYTLDEKVINQAYETFKKMWDEGLVYRGERLVNYCTHHRTGFADIEVEYHDSETPLYYMKYGPFTLATTRPETKFGDTAVAVHPDDKRFQKYVGQVIEVEGVNGPFEVTVIADKMVDRKFGTGVVKITPAHDFNDWEVAQRHNLPAVRVINHDGTMNEKAGKFRGMTVKEAREAVAKALEEKGLLVKVDKHYKNRVGKCYKCGTVIEPMLMKQWFIDMKPLAEPAVKALKGKQITFYPDGKRKQLIGYLEELKDWNISRQIAWGIPIPAFQNVDDEDDWIYDTRVNQEIIEVNGHKYRRDPDVFDTWFSSSSWPYATMDYPGGETYKDFYPNSLMETGGEILYPWVSRMIMLGLYVTGKIPFENVYIHGYVLAEDGSKMSKSVGNVIDPMAVLEQHGSDALRMGLVASRVPAVNRGFDHRKVEDGRNFANKLWNVARFIEASIGDDYHLKAQLDVSSPADGWILTKLTEAVQGISKDLENYSFAEAYERLYHFVWDDFADWYIEASKVNLNKGVLAYVLETTLKIAHPFAPFLTETIWQTLKWESGQLIITQWPKLDAITDMKNTSHYEVFSEIQTIVSEIRFISTSTKTSKPRLRHSGDNFLTDQAELIKRLSGASELTSDGNFSGLRLTQSGHDLWMHLDPATIAKFVSSLKTELETTKNSVKLLEGRLKNKAYTSKAPKELVEQTKQQLAEAEELLSKQHAEYERFKV